MWPQAKEDLEARVWGPKRWLLRLLSHLTPNQYHVTWASILWSSACRRWLCKDATVSWISISSDSREFCFSSHLDFSLGRTEVVESGSRQGIGEHKTCRDRWRMGKKIKREEGQWERITPSIQSHRPSASCSGMPRLLAASRLMSVSAASPSTAC